MKLIIYGVAYICGYLKGIIRGAKYSAKATSVYIEAKEKGGFDEDMKARLIEIARDYQKTDNEHLNVYDIIKSFDDVLGTKAGIHFN